jgi:hypothetical protein
MSVAGEPLLSVYIAALALKPVLEKYTVMLWMTLL